MDPLAEDHLKFKCDVGSSTSQTLTIVNKGKREVTYQASFDMHGVGGEKRFKVPAGGSY